MNEIDEIASLALTGAIMIFGLLMILGSLTRNPWEFASRPYRWIFQTVRSTIQNAFQRLFRLLRRVLRELADLILSGIIAFCRRFPKTTIAIVSVLVLGAIAVIALTHAGFL